MKVEFCRPNIEESDIARATEVLRGIIHTTGARCREFEEAFSAYRGGGHTVTVMSCTAGLAMALRALGIGPGDEVVTTPMTFVATAHAIEHVGARPVFAEVDPVTANLDPASAEAAITPRTRAIMPVHLYGAMCDMRAIREIASRHDLRIVEDAAHCVEGVRDGLRPGDAADMVCYSFYATKNLCCGEGGAVATADPALAERLRRDRLHGMTSGAADRYGKIYRHWDVDFAGLKANLTDIQAALLIGQMERIDRNLARREEISRRYEDAFEGIDGLDFPRIPEGSVSARHLFTLWVAPEDRDGFLGHLQASDIGVAVNYRAVHLLAHQREAHGYSKGRFPVAERIGDSTVSIPLHPRLTDEEVDRVIAAVRDWFGLD